MQGERRPNSRATWGPQTLPSEQQVRPVTITVYSARTIRAAGLSRSRGRYWRLRRERSRHQTHSEAAGLRAQVDVTTELVGERESASARLGRRWQQETGKRVAQPQPMVGYGDQDAI